MFSFKWIYFVIFTLIYCKSQAEISDKRLCIDVNCSELISIGKTLLRYSSPEENVLSFAPNEDVNVYSYGAGTRPELVGVEIKGRRGYINKNHFKETKLHKRPQLLVDTELIKNKPDVLLAAASGIQADPTQQPFEIVDGTRIPLDLASLSTEVPIAQVVNRQSSEEITKPLDSVPDNQNVNPAVPEKPSIGNTEQDKNIEYPGQQQQETDPVTNEDEDADEEDDDPNDTEGEDDESDEEAEMENKDTQASTEASRTTILESFPSTENVGVATNDGNEDSAGVTNNVPDASLKSTEASLVIGIEKDVVNDKNEETLNKDSSTNPEDVSPSKKHEEVTSEEEKKNEEIDVQPDRANEASSNIFASVAEKKQIIPEYVSQISENIKETLQQEQDAVKTKMEGFLPLVNIGAIQKPEVEKAHEETSNELITEDLKEDIERNVTDNVDSVDKENNLDETKELKLAEESLSPPIPVTETPLGNEIIPPVNLDVVTEDPVHSQNTNNILDENSKNDTEDGIKQSYSLPSDLMPEFKDPEEGADIKVEEKASGGFFKGLGSIFPLFNTGDDREVGEESTAPSSKENEIPEENVQPEGSESSFSYDSSKQDDGSLHLNSEQREQNSVVGENNPVTAEQSDLLQNLNSDVPEQNDVEEIESPNFEESNIQKEASGGIFENIMSDQSEDVKTQGHQDAVKEDFGAAASDDSKLEAQESNKNEDLTHYPWPSNNPEKTDEGEKFCDKEDHENCEKYQVVTDKVHEEKISRRSILGAEELQVLFIEAFSSDLFLYLATTALSVMILVFGMVILDKCRREGPLIARINKLEQQLLTTVKENEMLQEKSMSFVEEKTQLVVETVPNEMVEELNEKLAEMHQVKLALEEQVQALEKELDTSTEVGIELNRIITEMLNSSDGSEFIKENIEQMQKKLVEQQDTINTIDENLNLKETENHELRLEMEISNRRVTDLQGELDNMVDKILKIEEERDLQHSALENEIIVYKNKCKDVFSKEQELNSEIQALKQQITKFQRVAEVKVKEYNCLKESLNEIKAAKNNKNVLKSLLEVSEIKAQLEQFKSENVKYSEQLMLERESNVACGGKIEQLTQEVVQLREKYEQADKEKVEINTKLQVLNNYFKEKEDQMQKEISKYESLWAVKEGEATSTTERIRYMQEELQNYKAQNESLKQEIINQEVELKSQISMLEKKAHESWVANRQTERKLEEARQEAAQLRNRLTLRERAIAEGNNQTRIQSPLHQNGELPISPPPLDPTQSPPPLFNPRDHLAKSPPIPGMPPPFLPPPLGTTPFIPPPPLDGMMPPLGDMGGMPPPPFMPPLPPGMFPGDHRPPPLGRMSSPPPVGGRYTPESTPYSDYDRYSRRSRSPSPPYDSEYGASPPPIRGYSPYQDRLRDDRREYKRPQARSNGRNSKGMHSSGSENDSLGKINKKPQRKV